MGVVTDDHKKCLAFSDLAMILLILLLSVKCSFKGGLYIIFGVKEPLKMFGIKRKTCLQRLAVRDGQSYYSISSSTVWSLCHTPLLAMVLDAGGTLFMVGLPKDNWPCQTTQQDSGHILKRIISKLCPMPFSINWELIHLTLLNLLISL